MSVGLAAKVDQYRRLKTRIDSLSRELEAVKEEINAAMTAAGVDEITGDSFKVSRVKCERTSFDSKAFEVAHPRLFQAFSRVTSFVRLSVA